MFRKLLIANRGEIACRIAATAARLGIATVAVHSDADAHAQHVRACDEAVCIGGAAPRDSYLRPDAILQAARATGAEAVHPGYGFLSENAGFAEACAAAGLVFVGPPPAAIRAMGLKAESKRLMQAAGVPLVPGYHGSAQDAALLAREAARIGYPVLIKASAGGGGKGMRVVLRPEEFAAALAGCQREATASFGDAAVLIERCVQRPRHIEVQVFADTHGGLVHLFERDCSVQRRHQKLLEEAPAPGMTAALRGAMGAAALAAARAVGYVGAGTVEFIAEHDVLYGGAFYFMEMNTRLQVEHPVTEAIAGIDLVEWQLRVAAGERLPLAQAQLAVHGHAIEARVCAEHAEAGFLPSTGRLALLRWPAHMAFAARAPGQAEPAPVRIDSGVVEGDAVTPHYDPLLAKLIVWGADRAQALARLDAALAHTHIAGPHSNAAFLRRVAASPAFQAADLDTALIEREAARSPALFAPSALPIAVVAAADLAQRLAAAAAERADGGPWAAGDGWRLVGEASRWHTIDVGGVRHPVVLRQPRDGSPRLSAGGAEHRFDWRERPASPLATDAAVAGPRGRRLEVHLDGRRWSLTVHALDRPAGGDDHGSWAVFADGPAGGSARWRRTDPAAPADAASAPATGRLTAPMPGKIVAFHVRQGEQVRRGQPLAVMEAMKMEHTLHAPDDGTVGTLRFAAGDAVAEGQALLDFEAGA